MLLVLVLSPNVALLSSNTTYANQRVLEPLLLLVPCSGPDLLLSSECLRSRELPRSGLHKHKGRRPSWKHVPSSLTTEQG